jgi:hypothetical protein
MIRIWLGFTILFAVFYFGIPAFRHMTGKERWDLTKTFLFSIMCSLLAVIVMMLFVFLF